MEHGFLVNVFLLIVIKITLNAQICCLNFKNKVVSENPRLIVALNEER